MIAETLAMLGFVVVVLVLFAKMVNLSMHAKAYAPIFIYIGMIAAVIGYSLLFNAFLVETTVGATAGDITIETVDENVLIYPTGGNLDFYYYTPFVNIANVVLLLCGFLTVLETLFLLGSVDRFGEPRR